MADPDQGMPNKEVANTEMKRRYFVTFPWSRVEINKVYITLFSFRQGLYVISHIYSNVWTTLVKVVHMKLPHSVTPLLHLV